MEQFSSLLVLQTCIHTHGYDIFFQCMLITSASLCSAVAQQNLSILGSVQGSAKRRPQDLVNFIAARAYHFSLALPAATTQPGDHLLAEL